jgi:hypothetical protein
MHEIQKSFCFIQSFILFSLGKNGGSVVPNFAQFF